MKEVTDDMIDRHAARGVIVADQLRRGAPAYASEAEAVKALAADSSKLSRADGITDKGIAGFLALAAFAHFYLRLDRPGGAA